MNALWAYRLLTDAGKPFIESLNVGVAQGKTPTVWMNAAEMQAYHGRSPWLGACRSVDSHNRRWL